VRGLPAARSEHFERWCWYSLLVALAAWSAALALNPRRGSDLRIYLDAAERFWRGQALYPANDPIGFKYAPGAAWLFAPLTALPREAAAVLWNIGSVAAFAFVAARWRKLLAENERYAGGPWGAAAVVVLAQSFFLELFYGQVDLVILALLVWPFTPAGRTRDVWSGLSVAIAVVLKLPAAVIAAALLAVGRRRAVAWSIAWVVALHVPLALRFGFRGGLEQLRAWVATIEATEASWAVGHNTQGLPTLLLSTVYALDAKPTRAAQAIASLTSVAAVIALPLLAGLRGPALVALLCAGAALASPLAWRANFVLFWPLVATLACVRAPRTARAAAAIAIGLVAVVEWTVGEATLGASRARTVLAARPWAIAFTILTATALWVLPKVRRGLREATAPGAPP
jgi:alpha-1,2-mannosyltransferase